MKGDKFPKGGGDKFRRKFGPGGQIFFGGGGHISCDTGSGRGFLFSSGRGFLFKNLNRVWSGAQARKARNELECLEWAAQSPDLNPIGKLWTTLKRRISARDPPPKTVNEQKLIIVQEEWKKSHLRCSKFIVKSMPKRAELVIKATGFSTKY